jgi:Cu+-exporting ATPase
MEEDDTSDAQPLLGPGAAASGHAAVTVDDKSVKAPATKTEADSALVQLLRGAEKTGMSVSAVSVADVLVGGFAIHDTLRPSAPAAVKWLRESGKQVWMITGDNSAAAEAVAIQCGIDPANVKANVLPTGKSDAVKAIQRRGTLSKQRVVAMVGDGINDAPALVAADVGIAIGAGTNVAVDAADIVLMTDDVVGVATALSLSAAALNRIRLNLLLSTVYNILAVPVAAGALFPLLHTVVPPETAALTMALSSVSVVLSSLALSWFQPPLRSERSDSKASTVLGVRSLCNLSYGRGACTIRCCSDPQGYSAV